MLRTIFAHYRFTDRAAGRYHTDMDSLETTERLKRIVPDAQFERATVFGVPYVHLKFPDGDDLYVTEYGLPFIERIEPKRLFSDSEWFEVNSVPLSGTSSIYRVTTGEIEGMRKDLVVKWNRMGQEIPGVHESDDLADAEFNSPFEEFALVTELRRAGLGETGRVAMQKPLAIYVSARRIEPDRTGRKEYKMHAKIDLHRDVALDMFRPYAVIYEWIKGIDATEAQAEGLLKRNQVESLTLRSRADTLKRGFVVRDSKPHHVIVRPEEGGRLLCEREGRVCYGLVDYELLERTPGREAGVRKTKRLSYLERQKSRFDPREPIEMPSHLRHVEILGVDYVYGRAESAGGHLWVVGKDPQLFDYFLPERWEKTPRTKLSIVHDIYHTLTKDNINLVWQVSRVGDRPDADPFKEEENKILEHGYNSPFEEVSLAVYLWKQGIRTTYPRAVYAVQNRTAIAESLFDSSRFESHRDILIPDGHPVLEKDHDYVVIWGYWNGPDDKLAAEDGDYYEAIDALRAYREGLLPQGEYLRLLEMKKQKLARVGVEDLNLRGSHLLLSLDSAGGLIRGADGAPDVRICNFELLKKI